MKATMRCLALLAVGFLLGSMLAPVAAQQSPGDGQVAVRSDYAVYLISAGVRRWVPTLIISDDELNAIPEAEPIYVGLQPIGSGAAAAPAQPGAGQQAATGQQPGAAQQPAVQASPKPTAPPATTTPTTSTSTGTLNATVDSISSVERGKEVRIVTRSSDVKGKGTCEMKVTFADGTEERPEDKQPNSDGKCEWSVKSPDKSAAEGSATARVIFRDGDKSGEAKQTFSVTAKGSSSDNGSDDDDSDSGNFEIEFEDISDVRRGKTVTIEIDTSLENKGTCSGTIEYDNGDEESLSSKTPDGKGKVKWDVQVKDSSKVVGTADVEVECSYDGDEDSATTTFTVKD